MGSQTAIKTSQKYFFFFLTLSKIIKSFGLSWVVSRKLWLLWWLPVSAWVVVLYYTLLGLYKCQDWESTSSFIKSPCSLDPGISCESRSWVLTRNNKEKIVVRIPTASGAGITKDLTVRDSNEVYNHCHFFYISVNLTILVCKISSTCEYM